MPPSSVNCALSGELQSAAALKNYRNTIKLIKDNWKIHLDLSFFFCPFCFNLRQNVVGEIESTSAPDKDKLHVIKTELAKRWMFTLTSLFGYSYIIQDCLIMLTFINTFTILLKLHCRAYAQHTNMCAWSFFLYLKTIWFYILWTFNPKYMEIYTCIPFCFGRVKYF